MKLNPYLHFAGNAEEALNFYKNAFNGEILVISRYGESPMPYDEDYKFKIMHSRLQFEDNLIMISDVFKGQDVSTGGNIQLSLEVESEERLHEVFNKMSEEGKVNHAFGKTILGCNFWNAAR